MVTESSVDLKATLSVASDAAVALADEDGASEQAMVAAQSFLLEGIESLVYLGGSADAPLTVDSANDEGRKQRLQEAAAETQVRQRSCF
eukprot:SAG22_NODE_3609_length_1618_cov_1.111257_2_plen_89_part_00